MDFSLDQIVAFVTTVEQGSFKSAALKLGKHATTVSQQVAALEIDLGLQLFDRQVRKLYLTNEGKKCYESAKSVLVEAHHLQKTISGIVSDLPSSLRVALDDTVRDRQLIRCIKQVVEAYPTLDIAILHGDALSVPNMVKTGQADIGVSNSLFKAQQDLTTVQLFNYEIVAVGGPKWVGSNLVKTESELRLHPQIVMNYILQSESMHGHIISNRHYQTQSIADQMDMVSMGFGWAIVPKFQAQDLLDDGELVEFFIEGGKTVNWYAELLYRTEHEVNPAMRLFMENALKLTNR
ncbi:LysR family transcriptional regulator [Vibrio tubiashii]|uniref:LysR family transcriptional regulator n=1 Tax=Vibrio tubiashii TaxID=29498 RepID=UPI001EFDBD78|nr:LysR family transcriptional regulator [Vibrio tubiashii]MCG9615968.1 LysR family transcriptional regulator [Vibrio tubiashii]MCG9687133.1 LysR family transcriptional regulator [Vibrio tubiashii]